MVGSRLIYFSLLLYYRVRATALGPLVLIAILFVVEGSFWNTVQSVEGELGQYSKSQLLFYIYSAIVVYQLTACNGETDSLPDKVESGMFDNFLYKPIGFVHYMSCVQIGTTLARLILLLPILAGLCYYYSIGFKPMNMVMFLALIPMASILNFTLNTWLATFTFYFRDSYAFVHFKETLFWVLSGTLIPLDFFPKAVANLLPYFPPAYVVYYPTRVLMGLDNGWRVLGVTALLSFLCLSLAQFSLNHAVKHYQGYGG